MKPVPSLLPPPNAVLPDGAIVPLTSALSLAAPLDPLGPFPGEEPVIDDRLWVDAMDLVVEYRTASAIGIECGFFSEDYDEAIGGDPPGEGAYYEQVALTYDSAPDDQTVQIQTLIWAVDGEGNQSCTLEKDPEELPPPPGAAWELSGVEFTGALSPTHRHERALAVLAITAPAGFWSATSQVGIVENAIEVSSDEISAGRFEIRFRLATREFEPAQLTQTGLVAFAWRIDESGWEDVPGIAVQIALGELSGDPSASTVRVADVGETVAVGGPDVGASGSALTAPMAARSLLSRQPGLLPFLQEGVLYQRYLTALSEGGDPRLPDTGEPVDYAAEIEVSRDPDTGEVSGSQTPSGGDLVPPALAGIEILNPSDLDGLSPGLNFAADVDSPTLPRQERTRTTLDRSGFRRWKEEGVRYRESHWHRITLGDPVAPDAAAFADAWMSDDSHQTDGAESERLALGRAIAANLRPGHLQTCLLAESLVLSFDDQLSLADYWYHLFDEAGLPIYRRAVLPNGPAMATVSEIRVFGSTLDDAGQVIESWEEPLAEGPTEFDPLQWLATCEEGTFKRIDRVEISWAGDTRLAYPLAIADGADVP